MTRPISKNVDYFPHYIRKTPELKLIMHKHKSEGYMAYYKLLELVADAEYHYLSVKTDDEEHMFELGMENCDMEVVRDVIRILCNSGQINKEIWKNHKVIWMEDFVKKFRGVWYKRGKTLPKIDSNGNVSVPRNLQERKVKESKKYTLVDYESTKDEFISDDVAVGNIRKKYSLNIDRLIDESTLMIRHYSKNDKPIEDFEHELDTWLLRRKGIFEDAQHKEFEIGEALDALMSD